MNRLNPELKKLLKWAREAPQVPPPAMPLGFSGRIVARWDGVASDNPFAIWQKAVWRSAWAATVVILLGLLALTAEKLRPQTPYDFSPAYQVVATELVP